jgi:hypothetical protein
MVPLSQKVAKFYSPLATIITRLYEVTVYVFDHWISGKCDNVMPFDNLKMHFGLENNQNRKHLFWGRVSLTNNGVKMNRAYWLFLFVVIRLTRNYPVDLSVSKIKYG